MRDRQRLLDALARYESQAAEMYELAQQRMRDAGTPHEKDRANSLMRHAKGVIVHAGAYRQELGTS